MHASATPHGSFELTATLMLLLLSWTTGSSTLLTLQSFSDLSARYIAAAAARLPSPLKCSVVSSSTSLHDLWEVCCLLTDLWLSVQACKELSEVISGHECRRRGIAEEGVSFSGVAGLFGLWVWRLNALSAAWRSIPSPGNPRATGSPELLDFDCKTKVLPIPNTACDLGLPRTEFEHDGARTSLLQARFLLSSSGIWF